MVSPLEPQSDGYIGTLLESRGGSDLFGSMSLSYTPLCSGASVGITKAALVHENNLCSHRMERDRRTRERLWYHSLTSVMFDSGHGPLTLTA